MAVNTNARASLFPHMPRTEKIVDKEGELTEHWHLSIMNLYQTLQRNFRTTGFLLPGLGEFNIDNIWNYYQPFVNHILPKSVEDISGLTLFDLTNRIPKIFIITYNSNREILKADWYSFNLTATHP